MLITYLFLLLLLLCFLIINLNQNNTNFISNKKKGGRTYEKQSYQT